MTKKTNITLLYLTMIANTVEQSTKNELWIFRIHFSTFFEAINCVLELLVILDIFLCIFTFKCYSVSFYDNEGTLLFPAATKKVNPIKVIKCVLCLTQISPICKVTHKGHPKF